MVSVKAYHITREDNVRLDLKALAAAGAVLWGGLLLLLSLGDLVWAGYGGAILDLAASIYPGYDGPEGIGALIVATGYGLVDGAIGGIVTAWIYNRVSGAGAPT